MKKYISILMFSIVGFNSFNKDIEIVTNKDNQKIILFKDFTWMTMEKYNYLSSYNNKIKIIEEELSAKRSNGRTLSITLKNTTKENLIYSKYKIKWFVDNDYRTIDTFIVKNLEAQGETSVTKRVKLEGISGRDYKIEIIDYNFSD